MAATSITTVPQGMRRNLGVCRTTRRRDSELVPQSVFLQMLLRERKRAERLRKQLLVMVIETRSVPRDSAERTSEALGRALGRVIRDTDVAGLLHAGSSIGIVFPVMDRALASLAARVIESRITEAFERSLRKEVLQQVVISFVSYPSDSTDGGRLPERNLDRCPDLYEIVQRSRTPRWGRTRVHLVRYGKHV